LARLRGRGVNARRAAVCHQAAVGDGVAIGPLEGVYTRHLLAPLRCPRDRIARCAARDPGRMYPAPSFHAAREIVPTCRDGAAPMRWSRVGAIQRSPWRDPPASCRRSSGAGARPGVRRVQGGCGYAADGSGRSVRYCT